MAGNLDDTAPHRRLRVGRRHGNELAARMSVAIRATTACISRRSSAGKARLLGSTPSTCRTQRAPARARYPKTIAVALGAEDSMSPRFHEAGLPPAPSTCRGSAGAGDRAQGTCAGPPIASPCAKETAGRDRIELRPPRVGSQQPRTSRTALYSPQRGTFDPQGAAHPQPTIPIGLGIQSLPRRPSRPHSLVLTSPHPAAFRPNEMREGGAGHPLASRWAKTGTPGRAVLACGCHATTGQDSGRTYARPPRFRTRRCEGGRPRRNQSPAAPMKSANAVTRPPAMRAPRTE
jgi:hypothetical protein